MNTSVERKNPFLTPGTATQEAPVQRGPLEKTVFFGKALASLIPITYGLSLAIHTGNQEYASAAQEVLPIARGMLIVAGAQILQNIARETDTAIKNLRVNKN